jgi:hypothetical protein
MVSLASLIREGWRCMGIVRGDRRIAIWHHTSTPDDWLMFVDYKKTDR